MSEEYSISAYHNNEFSWIRCDGKGSFINSPLVKDWCEKELGAGATCIVVDLEECKGMDSTFMGTMAGLAMRLMKLPKGRLQIAGPSERSRKSLEDLGLDVLMDIDPEEASWRQSIEDIRANLVACRGSDEKVGQGVHVLDAHRKLCEADNRNTEKFGTVVDYLEAEVKAKQSDDE
ncbi:MAG: STAS domain-containing protein [Akkermansiaceae bacterium]|nr:STAS domain-containing protein [Akkermansiaceae bacterium]